MNIIKAAVGFVLANDKLGLSRLRSKFGERMAQSPEWPMFDYVTEPDRPPRASSSARSPREVAGLDSLNAFLARLPRDLSADDGADARTRRRRVEV